VTPNGVKEGKLYSVIPSDGSGDMSVVRATTATRVNSAGLVELVPYNFVKYSQEISNTSFWAHYLSTLTANTTTAPDGTLTADTIAITGSSGSAYQFHTYSGGIHTLSCYFKKINEDNVYIDGNSSSGYYGAAFNLTTQAITLFGGGFSPLIESVGNGWYRCSVQADGNGSGYYGFGVYAGAGQSAYIWGAQLNEGTIKTYQKTETRLNIPRLDYSNGSCPSLLVEPQRTNISNYIESGTGNWQAATVTSANSILGLKTFNVIADGVIFGDQPHINSNSEFQANSKYTCSFYTDFSQCTGISITCNLLGFFPSVAFASISINKTTKVITTQNVGGVWTIDSSSATQINGEIYKISFTATPNLTSIAGSRTYIYGNLAGHFAGIQLEAGAYGTSFINKPTSASVTRNADVISKTGISSLIGQTEGTIFFDGVINGCQNAAANLVNSEKNTNTSFSISYAKASKQIVAYIYDGNEKGRIQGGIFEIGQRIKVAYAYKSANFVLYVNGIGIGTNTNTFTFPSTLDDIFIGDPTTYFSFGESIQNNSTALWKTCLTNAQLASLTSL
jgi:hypothetical protein